MDITHPLPTQVTSLAFSFLSSEDIRRISVERITNPLLLDNLNLPTKNGLYDPKLGPMGKADICETCNLNYFNCPGHFGHIELPAPVYHPLFMNQCYGLLRSVCLFCHNFKMPDIILRKYVGRLQLLDAGLLDEALRLVTIAPRTSQQREDDEEEHEAVPTETAAEFIARIDAYVQHCLKRASNGGQTSKDAYKDGLVYQERKSTLHEFNKKAWNKCAHCMATGYTFRKEKSAKIIEYDLSAKHKMAHTLANIRRPDVLRSGAALLKKAQREREIDEGYAHSESEAEEDAVDHESSSEGEQEAEGDNVPRTASGQEKSSRGRNERVMPPDEVRAHLQLVFAKEPVICGLLYGRHGTPNGTTSPVDPNMFFMDVVPVPPTRFRPASMMGDELFENSQNSLLTAVIKTCERIRDLNVRLVDQARAERGELVLDAIAKAEEGQTFVRLLEALIQLQHDVNSFMDSSKNPTIMRGGKLPPQGVKQVLEKKEGLFRKHMMGKRVNYAARSVISPDINIETNEIGIPPVFARKLTYPEPVTQHNLAQMRQLVINGPKIYPGASMVQNEDGTQISLEKASVEQRTAIANQLLTPHDSSSLPAGPTTRTTAVNKKVFRHIRDGDVVILNRQPTLHKPSMMAHKARILLGEKTIRMHYANCNSYNADFDGDEMNIHFPQNEVARAEAQMIANTDNQYLVPTSGNPLRGLIQDHVVAGVWMCNKSTFFTREEYFQLIYGALRTENNYTGEGRIKTLPPAIFKPRPMWTGKQLMSTMLLNLTPRNAQGLNLLSKNKIDNKLWGRDDSVDPFMSEENVIFQDGHLVCGVLDKSQYGASAFGLVHSVHELYGPGTAGRLLGVLSRLLTKYLQHRAFTCRMDDLILTAEGERIRKQILDDAAGDGAVAAMEYVGLPEGSRISDPETARHLNIRLEEILRDDNLMAGLDKAMQRVFSKTQSKINNIVVPAHLVKPFPVNNMQAMTISGAKGSKVNATQISTLLGQQALEGRRVPTMVSGKTLPSFKPFDTAARAGGFVANRFLTGIRPQEYYFHCMAGREGLIDTAVKTSRSGYLQRCLIKHLEGVRVHYDHTVRDSDQSVLQFFYGEDSLDVTKQKHLKDFEFAARNHESLINKYRPSELEGKVEMNEAVKYMKKALKKQAKYLPVMSEYSPSRFLGAMSEAYSQKVDSYAELNPHKLVSNSKAFKQLARIRYMRSLVDPGEAVGLLASQGVGEPSTQMTLNTFHLAGHGAANVTLGIPRLREIVMTASAKPMTPTMTLPLHEHISDKQAVDFVKDTSRLTLSQIVDKVTVTERLSGKNAEANNSRMRTYTVLLDFYPTQEYCDEYHITPVQVQAALAYSLGPTLQKEIKDELQKNQATLANDLGAIGKGLKQKAIEDEAPQRRGRDDEIDDDDEDAGQLKRKSQARQHEYAEDESDAGLGDLEDILEETAPEVGEDVDADEVLAKAKAGAVAEELADIFTVACKFATSFSFDHEGGRSCQFDLNFAGDAQKLLLVDIIERCCRSAVIHEVDNITRCLKMFDDKGAWNRKLMTEGSNLKGMWDIAGDMVDLAKIESNDVFAIKEAYGVEAARASIIRELSSIFGAYGIAVDYRHLTVIADYMTHDGGYKPFNRTGISSKSSPLLKASFETTVAFLSEATLHGDFDNLESPAAKIVLGKPSTTGSGSFDLRTVA